jgi:hypothetical protein
MNMQGEAGHIDSTEYFWFSLMGDLILRDYNGVFPF